MSAHVSPVLRHIGRLTEVVHMYVSVTVSMHNLVSCSGVVHVCGVHWCLVDGYLVRSIVRWTRHLLLRTRRLHYVMSRIRGFRTLVSHIHAHSLRAFREWNENMCLLFEILVQNRRIYSSTPSSLRVLPWGYRQVRNPLSHSYVQRPNKVWCT